MDFILLIKTFWSKFLHDVKKCFQKNNVERSRHKYIITYQYGSHEYKIICKRQQSRIRILHIENEHGDDVLEHVKQYMGPNSDFHGMKLSPSDLGHKKLTFHIFGGEIKQYDENDIIVI